MRSIILVTALGLGIAGCAPSPPVSTAIMPPQTGLGDPVNSVQYAAWAFAWPSRTRNDPLSAAKAVAALDFAAGDINTSQNWKGMSPIIWNEMLIARTDVRRVLGIPAEAPSQAVVNAMTRTMLALEAGNQPEALAALSSPIFTFGPERTLTVLSNLPYIRMANVATADAENTINCVRCAAVF